MTQSFISDDKVPVYTVSFGEDVGHEIRFFGRRRGKAIKASRQKLLDELLPRLTPKIPKKGEKFNMPALFSAPVSSFCLEVGFGGGEHLAALAFQQPAVGFIGAEPFLNGVSSLLAHVTGTHLRESTTTALEPGRVDNVRVWPDDVRELFPYFPNGVFNRVFVLYPDPWPKARHAERRFINAANLKHLSRLMKTGGLLYVATDVAAYAEWTLDQIAQNGLFEQINKDTSCPPVDWVPTRYEQKALNAGRTPVYLVFQKKSLR